jgi:hypothetical protein
MSEHFTCFGVTRKGGKCKNRGKYKVNTDDKNIELFCKHHVEKSNEDCSICLSKLYNIEMLYCGHQFHTECINRWIKYKRTCPICRCIIYDDITVPHDTQLDIYINSIPVNMNVSYQIA